MNEEKYYTPTIDDFRLIGMKYESKITVVCTNGPNEEYWSKSETSFDSVYGIRYGRIEEFDTWVKGNLRIKYLDKADIESLGGEIIIDNDTYISFTNVRNEFQITVSKENRVCIIDTIKNNSKKHVGLIKNITELKHILNLFINER